MATQAQLEAQYGNEAKVYFNLRKGGWNHKGVCAVMGNIKQESGFSPGAKSSDGFGSYGLCQWTGGRKSALFEFLARSSQAKNSIKGQCDFLIHETKTSYPTIHKKLSSATPESVRDLCKYFCDKWERPNPRYANYANRMNSAQTYYDRYKGSYTGNGAEDDEGNGTGIDFNKTVAKLISSDNMKYIEREQQKEESYSEKYSKSFVSQLKDALNIFTKVGEVVNQGAINLENLLKQQLAQAQSSTVDNREFISQGEINGSTLPIYKTFVEAPFVECTIGGVTFGTYQRNKLNSYPNYIESLKIEKTNGTINIYTLNLIHKIPPGDNPNYIAGLISNNGFNKIKISYGDANSGQYFSDIDALMTDVNTSFDFSNQVIRYTITASSLSYLLASTKLNFQSVTAKPSTVIRDLLSSQKDLLTEYFTGMKDLSIVDKLGLIPSNDKEIEISAVTDKTVLEYLQYLTSLMVDENSDLASKSSYYLFVDDDTFGPIFRIKEVIAGISNINDLVYEVDINYPDENMAFDFNTTTDYAWTIAKESSANVDTYRYDIDNGGNINKSKANNYISTVTSDNRYLIDDNTWKDFTRFPITATLSTKQLMAPIQLLTYIKINNVYFGYKRITSGMYIVTGQIDTISNRGCRSTLQLTRVASETESLVTDGRIIT